MTNHNYNINMQVSTLVHPPNELVDRVFPVPVVSSFNEVPGLLPIATTSIAQLEWPQEVVGFLEVWPHSEDFMNKVLHTDDTIFAQFL